MSGYAKIQKRIWNSRTFVSLEDDAKFLFLYLLTCPHGNMLGLFILKPGYAQEDLGWTAQRFTKSFGELLHKPLSDGREGLIKYDEKTKMVWIQNYLEHNPIINHNQVKAAEKKLQALPYSELFRDVKLLVELLDKSFKKSLYKPLATLLAEPVAVTVTVAVTEEQIVQDAGANPEPVFVSIPLKDNSDFHVTESTLQEFKNSYPDQDVEQTLRDIRLWNISNKPRRKTRTGVMGHITSWLKRNHDKGKNRLAATQPEESDAWSNIPRHQTK